MRQLGIKGLPTRRLQGVKVGKVTSLDLARRELRRITERATREGEVVLLRRPGRVLTARGRLVDRQHPDHDAGPQRVRAGDPPA